MLKTMLMLLVAIIAAVVIMILLATVLPVDSKWYIPLLLLCVSLFGIIAAITEVRIKKYWAAKKAKSDIDIFDTLFEQATVEHATTMSKLRDDVKIVSAARQAMAEKRLRDNLEAVSKLTNIKKTIV